MYQSRRQIVEQLGIDIDRLFERLKTSSSRFTELDEAIICRALQGQLPQAMALSLDLSGQTIRDRLSRQIYPGFAELMQVDQKEIAGNWAAILNFLLSPSQGYRLTPAPQLNQDNFQASLGRQIFLSPPDQQVVKLQTDGVQFYQQGKYYQAAQCFLWAWQQEKTAYETGNPEVLIYLNNALLEHLYQSDRAASLETAIELYTVAVVVPFHHNQGQIAAEILQGVAQLQLQINLQMLEQATCHLPIDLAPIRPSGFFRLSQTGRQTGRRMGLRILVVNDPNNLYSPQNQTAEQLAALAERLNLIAVMGHYSSEMTEKALSLYAQQGLALINFSSSSDRLSQLAGGEALSFFRLTTPDDHNAARLAAHLAKAAPGSRTAIIYNQDSSYSNSYRAALMRHLTQTNAGFTYLETCGDLGRSSHHIQRYLDRIQPEVELILLIPDGGLEPNSLNNAGLISRLSASYLVAGSATFCQENLLNWLTESSKQPKSSQAARQSPIACVPWHWQSRENGAASKNFMAQQFCQSGRQLWGEAQLNWRSATAYDALLLIVRAVERHPVNQRVDRQALLVTLNRCFRAASQEIMGVTGKIQFDQAGNRIAPPTEIVAVGWNPDRNQWQWNCLS